MAHIKKLWRNKIDCQMKRLKIPISAIFCRRPSSLPWNVFNVHWIFYLIEEHRSTILDCRSQLPGASKLF